MQSPVHSGVGVPAPPAFVPSGARELDSRVSDGMCITLYWHESSGLYVRVDDARYHVGNTIRVANPADASHAFHHPFPYVAQHPSLVLGEAAVVNSAQWR